MALFYLNNTPHGKTKTGEYISTKNHYDYITREGKYGKLEGKEDLVYTMSGNMPDWCNGNPGEYWKQAELHRRKNGRAYREIKLGLQEELTLEENIQCVEKFMDHFSIGQKHAFSYAIHDKPAAFDSVHRNIHAHLMFSEKVIEKNRPLDPEHYWNRYTIDKETGEPTKNSGYANDRYFNTVQSTRDMRKVWADIVNEKFRELGINKTISEKTLKAQHDELVKQGRDEEAEYYDREPAPHMGKIYRNPEKMEMIRDMTEEYNTLSNGATTAINRAPDEEKEETENYWDAVDDDHTIEHQRTLEEMKMLMFANDALVRRTARELQQERAKYREEVREAERQQDELDKIPPMVITTTDIAEAFAEKSLEADKLAYNAKLAFEEYRKRMLKDTILYAQAREEIVPGYKAAKAAYDQAQKDYNIAQVEVTKASGHGGNVFAAMQTEQETRIKYYEASNRFALLDKQCHVREHEINDRYQEKKMEQIALDKQVKKTYAEYNRHKSDRDMYYARSIAMRQSFAPDTIMFSEALPDMVDKNLRVYGRPNQVLRKMPQAVYHGSTYFLISTPDPRWYSGQGVTVYGVRYGDDVVDGKSKSYLLHIHCELEKNAKGKNMKVLKIDDVKPGDREVNYYQTRNRNTGKMFGRSDGPIWHGHTSQGQNLLEKVTKQLVDANARLPKTALARWDDLQNQHKQKVDEYDRTQQELERFADSLRLGGGRSL